MITKVDSKTRATTAMAFVDFVDPASAYVAMVCMQVSTFMNERSVDYFRDIILVTIYHYMWSMTSSTKKEGSKVRRRKGSNSSNLEEGRKE